MRSKLYFDWSKPFKTTYISSVLYFIPSFNMNLSTEPSIETLPEYYANGTNVVDTNVINDQTIAIFCSDTVRELNNLTEELQQTDLNDIGGRINYENPNSFHNRLMESAFSSSTSVQLHNDAIGSVHSSNGDNQSNGHHSFGDHNYAIPYHNNTLLNDKLSTETKIGNFNCDVVDSSPFYTHFNTHLENNMDDDDKMNQISLENSHHIKESYGSTNGRVSSEGLRDDDYRVAMCMLQSVDLRGK